MRFVTTLAAVLVFGATNLSVAQECSWQTPFLEMADSRIVDLAVGPALTVGVGGLWGDHDGSIITRTTDGVAWFATANPTSEDLNAVTWTGTQFIAVGNNGAVIRSPDGQSWQVLPRPALRKLTEVAGNKDEFLVFGRSFCSRWTGEWQPCTPPPDTGAVVTNGEVFVATGRTDGDHAWYSRTGEHWTRISSDVWATGDNNWKNQWDTVWDGQQFWILCPRGLASSSDGISWVLEEIDLGNLVQQACPFGYKWASAFLPAASSGDWIVFYDDHLPEHCSGRRTDSGSWVFSDEGVGGRWTGWWTAAARMDHHEVLGGRTMMARQDGE